jgi:hypothetical protein
MLLRFETTWMTLRPTYVFQWRILKMRELGKSPHAVAVHQERNFVAYIGLHYILDGGCQNASIIYAYVKTGSVSAQ